MASEDSTGSDAGEDTREQGIEFGELKGKLEAHDYPADGDELVAAYGDHELGLPGGSSTLREILGKRHGEDAADDIRYESAEEVHQSISNMVGSDAVGREDYTDRAGGDPAGVDGDDRQHEESM